MTSPIPQHVCMLCGMSFRTSSLLRKHEFGGFCLADDEHEARDIHTASTDIEQYTLGHSWDDGFRTKKTGVSQRPQRDDIFRELQDQRQHLLRQKEDIDNQLDSLRLSGVSPSTQDILAKIQQKEEQNSQMLNNMRFQLNQLQGRNSRDGRRADPSLLSDIHELRQRYLRQGGGNAEILSQLASMELEAQQVHGQHSKNPNTQKYNTLADRLQDLELENLKLKSELAGLQDKNNDRLALYQANRERDSYERQLLRRQIDNEQRLGGLQHELDRLMYHMNTMNYQRALPFQPYPNQQMPRAEPQPQDVQVLSVRTPMDHLDDLQPAPYDPVGGFAVFYDFVLGLLPSVTACRLLIALHRFGTNANQIQILPDVPVFPQHLRSHAKMALRQPVPSCTASGDLGLLIQLQVSFDQASSMVTAAWTRLHLFDQYNRLVSGYWRVPLRTAPVQANTPAELLNNIPQYGDGELYIRLVNARDVPAQLQKDVDIHKANMYKFMPQINSLTTQVPPPPTASPPPDTPQQTAAFRDEPESVTLGFQVDRVKYAEPGEAKVRVTVYEKQTGKVAQSRTSAITCSTVSVDSDFRYNYHIFGLQEALFEGVNIETDLVLVARLYLILRGNGRHVSDESLVAWAAMPLTLLERNQSRRYNIGSKTLTLFEPPVPSVSQILLDSKEARSSRRIYRNKATLKLNVFLGEPRPGSLTPSLPSDDEESDFVGLASIPSNRDIPLTEPYLQTQGFDLYIDCCRYLPDAVTITKIAGRLLSRNYDKYGKDINAVTTLDTDAFNPVFDFRMEFRQPNIPPTATLLLKVYTVDESNKQLTVVGYGTLNIFVECGTDKQPTSDASGTQVALNEGGHQLRLFHKGPSGEEPFSESVLRSTAMRIVPCASLLVRIVKAPIGPKGKSLESSKVPKKDWEKLGLYIPRPQYEFGVYYTSKCQPTSSEKQLFEALVQRSPVLVRDVLPLIARDKDSKALRSDKGMEKFIQTVLEKTLDNTPVDLDLAYISSYRPKSGIMVAVDAAFNLPWSGFTFGVVALNPPASFYQGPPKGAYDKPTFLQKLDLNSMNKAPVWKDGFVSFPNRSFIKNLTLIVHLQEIQVSIQKDSYVYQLMDQAWTAVQVFTNGYAETNYFQLPLISGSPTRQHLEELTLEPCRAWIQRNTGTGMVKAADDASVIVRLSDGRRDSELPPYSSQARQDINTEYLYLVPGTDYSIKSLGHSLMQDVPEAKDPQRFPSQLTNQFKTLVYKVYEEGNLGT